MKYSIVYLIRGKTEKFHKKKVKELALKFKEPYLLDNPIPSHATLKYPFLTNRIKEIEIMLKKFTENQNKSLIKIRKVKNFHKKVIYLKLDFSKESTKVFNNLIKELKKLKWLDWRKLDNKRKFHATLIYGNTPESFKKIWREVSKLKPKFDLNLDNITILKKLRKHWKIYKTFEIK